MPALANAQVQFQQQGKSAQLTDVLWVRIRAVSPQEKVNAGGYRYQYEVAWDEPLVYADGVTGIEMNDILLPIPGPIAGVFAWGRLHNKYATISYVIRPLLGSGTATAYFGDGSAR